MSRPLTGTPAAERVEHFLNVSFGPVLASTYSTALTRADLAAVLAELREHRQGVAAVMAIEDGAYDFGTAEEAVAWNDMRTAAREALAEHITGLEA